MKLEPDRLQQDLALAVGHQVEVRPHDQSALRVETPFTFPDGDRLVIRLRDQNGVYEWTDLGHTLMHLSYDIDYDALSSGRRGELLEHTLTRLGLENRDGELVLAATSGNEFGESLLRFAQALLHVSDLHYLSRERVRSTFIEDVMRLLEREFPGRTTRDYHDREHDPKGEYPIDCLVNHAARPVAVFAVLNDDRCRDATITLQQFRAWDRQLFSTAIFEDQERINRRVLARFSNACDKQFASLLGQERDIVAYVQRLLN
jgi:hypothetical protein